MSAAYWKPVLQAFATAPEPISWELKGLGIDRVPKYEALLYLLEKELIVVSGRERRKYNDKLYSVTAEGLMLYSVIKNSIGKGRMKHASTTAAQRAVASGPVDVFDLARKPWVWDKAAERRSNYVEERVEEMT